MLQGYVENKSNFTFQSDSFLQHLKKVYILLRKKDKDCSRLQFSINNLELTCIVCTSEQNTTTRIIDDNLPIELSVFIASFVTVPQPDYRLMFFRFLRAFLV